MEIKVIEYEDYWECADGCCSNLDTVSTFYWKGKEYEYRNYDSHKNLLDFAKEHLNLNFEYVFERPDDVE